jgi:hypothetical protein
VITYNGPETGPGASYSWDSKGRAGKGSSAITDVSPPSRVGMRLDMEKPDGRAPQHRLHAGTERAATEMSWTMAGLYPYVNRVMGTNFNMDKMIGGPSKADCQP